MVDVTTSHSVQPVRKGNKKIFIIAAIVLILLALMGALFMSRQSASPQETEVTVTETAEPSPTDKPEVNREEVKIQVLNGTGTPGQAGEAVEALTDAGYTEGNIETGNAEEYETRATMISYKEGFEDVANDVKDALGSAFDEVDVDSTTLDEDSEYDIVIVTGGDVYEEDDSPTAAPTSGSQGPTATPAPTSNSPTATPTP